MNNQDIGSLLKQIHDKMKVSADASLKEIGLTISQAMAMEFLHEKGGKVAHPTVVGIVSRLEKNGFITCYVDETDRRNKIICVTDKAEKNAEKMYNGRAEAESRLLQSLSAEEIEELRRLLQILYNNVK